MDRLIKSKLSVLSEAKEWSTFKTEVKMTLMAAGLFGHANGETPMPTSFKQERELIIPSEEGKTEPTVRIIMEEDLNGLRDHQLNWL